MVLPFVRPIDPSSSRLRATATALCAARLHLASIGIPGEQAQVLAVAAIRTFLENLADAVPAARALRDLVDEAEGGEVL